MKNWFPYWLLLPPTLVILIWAASALGYEPYPISTLAALGGAAFWVLLFLIVHGSLRGWRCTRVFIVLFIVGTFAAILCHQIVRDLPLYLLALKLAGAAIISAMLYAVFSPSEKRKKKRPPKPTRQRAED